VCNLHQLLIPYDGGDVGSYGYDTIPDVYMRFSRAATLAEISSGGALYTNSGNGIQSVGLGVTMSIGGHATNSSKFIMYPAVNVGREAAPARLSLNACISY